MTLLFSQEEITDTKQHSKLLKTFGVEERKKKIKERILPIEPSEKEVEGESLVMEKYCSSYLNYIFCSQLTRVTFQVK